MYKRRFVIKTSRENEIPFCLESKRSAPDNFIFPMSRQTSEQYVYGRTQTDGRGGRQADRQTGKLYMLLNLWLLIFDLKQQDKDMH